MGFREIDRERLDLRFKRERFGRQARHFDQRTYQHAFILRREHTAHPTRRDREACQDGELTRERLAGCHTDFAPCQRRQDRVASRAIVEVVTLTMANACRRCSLA